MPSAKLDPEIQAHLEWIGFVRPTGLVVSAPALVRAGVILDRRDAEGQRLLKGCTLEKTFDSKEGPVPYLPNFRAFAESVLGWNFSSRGYAGVAATPIPPELEVPLPDYGETLRPDFAVRELEPREGAPPWQLLVRILEPGTDFDRVVRESGALEASVHGRMERLLRHTGVAAGLLVNGRALRLLSAPRGESSGWLDFRVEDMVQTAGRPISTAMRLLLNQPRLLSLPRSQRLAALLEESRRYQNEVSERLAEQVLHALYELLRGFQAAHDASKANLLREPLAKNPDAVYRALLTVILRLVFLLYAEERDMLPEDETFLRHYSLAGLYERLREDCALFPDTMDQRYGAWSQLLVLFRMIHGGADALTMRLPPRHGALFDPDRFPFLEGRASQGASSDNERIDPPLVPDGTIYRTLDKLLVLDGERISYRALDVEQIGSVYETMMGFRLETTTGRSVAIKPQKKQGAPTAIDIETLLIEPRNEREKWVAERADRRLPDTVRKSLKAASTLEDLHAALLPVIDLAATPDLVAKGAMLLQPSEERRRSGSHYTPRALTEPIVRRALEPAIAQLRSENGRPPRPEQILELKVCDPAMGSGAFLVEACRQLGDALLQAWQSHDARPAVPPDEDEIVFARRLIAQRCLYGVDRNPVAVDLAKVSLWLVTLAREHALTFLDHALRHGDSLVGLSRKQIESFQWDRATSRPQVGFETMHVREHVAKALHLRDQIREASDSVSDRTQRALWHEAQLELDKVRFFGDLVVAAHFEGEGLRERESKRSEYASAVVNKEFDRYRGFLNEWRHAAKPLAPFHWEIEFPEVFEGPDAGFHVIVGNPPFAYKNTLIHSHTRGYVDWLKQCYEDSHGNSDLVAYFFRRSFDLLRSGGVLGMLATNTIAQGDTRATGLRWIRQHGGWIISARRRLPWPGRAAVTVSVIHIMKDQKFGIPILDGREVDEITAYLFHVGTDDDPVRLNRNVGLSYVGSTVLGLGFIFDDTCPESLSIQDMEEAIRANPACAERIFPYVGGEDINESPTHTPRRWIINLGLLEETEARRSYPQLMALLERKVKPERMKKSSQVHRTYWWRFHRPAPALYDAIGKLDKVLALSSISAYLAVTRVSARQVFSHNTTVIALDSFAAFAILQSRAHEAWVHFTSSTLEERLGYRPTDCFETFPFPKTWEAHVPLEIAGRAYYEQRATIMVQKQEGLTKTYNRFHDPDELDPGIARLRELHSNMDRAVLDAYGWSDVPVNVDFLLDYERDEEDRVEKKKPWRYRWSDAVRDEVLARLLELNAARAREETYSGANATANQSIGGAPKATPKIKDLFA